MKNKFEIYYQKLATLIKGQANYLVSTNHYFFSGGVETELLT